MLGTPSWYSIPSMHQTPGELHHSNTTKQLALTWTARLTTTANPSHNADVDASLHEPSIRFRTFSLQQTDNAINNCELLVCTEGPDNSVLAEVAVGKQLSLLPQVQVGNQCLIRKWMASTESWLPKCSCWLELPTKSTCIFSCLRQQGK
jgi:hypothetical protein